MSILKQNQISYYGDQTRWFMGTVIDVNDPLQLGRVKVRIFGIHSDKIDDIGDDDLPWAQTVAPITEGGSSGLGANVGIKERAQVFGIFLDGPNSQLPLVIGSVSKIEKPRGGATSIINEMTGSIKKETSSTPDDSKLVGGSNAEKAFNFFISYEGGRFTPAQAAGIIGNLQQESGINPGIVSEFEGEGSFGIAQWNPSPNAGNRLGELKKFAANRNLSYASLYTQLLFIKYELETIPYLGMSKLRKAKTPTEAATIFCNFYERPNKNYAHINQRVAKAKEVLEKLG